MSLFYQLDRLVVYCFVFLVALVPAFGFWVCFFTHVNNEKNVIFVAFKLDEPQKLEKCRLLLVFGLYLFEFV